MNTSTGTTTSVWMKRATDVERKPLAEDLDCDVCVVGAGISGLTTAYLLAKEGRRVVVLDLLSIGGGETGRTTAHLSFALDDRYFELERLHGEQGARLAAESHQAAVDRIEQIAADEHIDCDFTRLDGYLFTPPGESDDVLRRELDAAHRAGLADVTWVDRAPLPRFDTGPALRFPRQGQFHPMAYLQGLAKAVERAGGRIFTGTHVKNISGGQPAKVETADGRKVTARAVVVATNTPINDRVTMHTKQAPYRTYAIGLRVPMGSVPLGLYWDTPDPYHYVRLQHISGGPTAPDLDHDVLIVGGEDHKTGQHENEHDRFAALEAWTRERFDVTGVEFRWSGQVQEPSDGLAYIGRNPGDEENVYIITGDSGHGITHGTLGAVLVTDLIQGRENPWTGLYNPARMNLKATKEFLSENLNVMVEYGRWLTGGEVSSPAEIPPDCGAVIRSGRTKLAVYRDAGGELHQYTAVCPHLGCIVSWNDIEKSWDCPCHGSRWTVRGEIITGPAISDLDPAESPVESR